MRKLQYFLKSPTCWIFTGRLTMEVIWLKMTTCGHWPVLWSNGFQFQNPQTIYRSFPDSWHYENCWKTHGSNRFEPSWHDCHMIDSNTTNWRTGTLFQVDLLCNKATRIHISVDNVLPLTTRTTVSSKQVRAYHHVGWVFVKIVGPLWSHKNATTLVILCI